MQGFFTEFQQQTGGEYYSDRFESYVKLPSKLGQGITRSFQFSSGIELYIQEYQTSEPLIIETEAKFSSLGWGWGISGNVYSTLGKTNIGFKPGQSLMTYSSNVYGSVELAAKEKILVVELGIESDAIKKSFSKKLEQFLPDCKSLIDSKNSGFYTQLAKTTPEMTVALYQILNCPYQGLTKELYLESKALELLTLNLAQLSNNQRRSPKTYQPKSEEIERLHYAKEILIANLDNPPSLTLLAKQIGLNEYKLKSGFRYVFGTTVFGYLHSYRMERSRLLLESGAMNVTEVATRVGYSNMSHFAAAFRKKFGINPSVFKSRRR